MHVLFVRGFATSLNGPNRHIYDVIELFFQNPNYSFEFFDYDPNSDLEIVYELLKKRLENLADPHKTIVIGHSLGGGLLLNLIDKGVLKRFHKIILIMPFIMSPSILKWVAKISFLSCISLPKCLLLPNRELFEYGNIFNDDWYLIPIKQLISFEKKFSLKSEQISNVLNHYFNVHMIYAKNEKLTAVHQNILNEIKNISFVNGNHLPFNEINCLKEFFQGLSKCLVS
jgi:hypothetical protein